MKDKIKRLALFLILITASCIVSFYLGLSWARYKFTSPFEYSVRFSDGREIPLAPLQVYARAERDLQDYARKQHPDARVGINIQVAPYSLMTHGMTIEQMADFLEKAERYFDSRLQHHITEFAETNNFELKFPNVE